MKQLISLFCTGLCIALLAITGCSAKDTFNAKTYLYGENPIVNVSIDVSDRQIYVEASEDENVYIDYYDGKKEYLDIGVSGNDSLNVKLVLNKNWTDFIGTKASNEYRKITVKLPQSVTALSIKTSNEVINIAPVKISHNVMLTNNGGNVLFDKIEIGKSININVKNGDIAGTILGGWDDFSITCNIKKGETNLPSEKSGGEKSLTATCNNGNVNVLFVK